MGLAWAMGIVMAVVAGRREKKNRSGSRACHRSFRTAIQQRLAVHEKGAGARRIVLLEQREKHARALVCRRNRDEMQKQKQTGLADVWPARASPRSVASDEIGPKHPGLQIMGTSRHHQLISHLLLQLPLLLLLPRRLASKQTVRLHVHTRLPPLDRAPPVPGGSPAPKKRSSCIALSVPAHLHLDDSGCLWPCKIAQPALAA